MKKLKPSILWIINSSAIIAILAISFILESTPNEPTFNRQLINVAGIFIMIFIVAILAILNLEHDKKC